MSKGHKPGGGIKSRQKVSVAQRLGQPRERIRPTGVAQYGQAQGSHVTGAEGGGGDLNYHGVKAHTGKPGLQSREGNMVAATTVCGPGGSRTIYKTGVQGVHGNANPGKPMSGVDPLAPWSRK
jgi:hypothetical protein